MDALSCLEEMRNTAGERVTSGLAPAYVEDFLAKDPDLHRAISLAYARFKDLKHDNPNFLNLDEVTQIKSAQDGLLNFYPPDNINPYLPLAGIGPWIVSSCGAVIHDSGGYGMLGFGHSPPELLEVISRPQVMANVMTASLAQKQFFEDLSQALARPDLPYSKYVCLNSGSELMSIAVRLADLNASNLLKERYAGYRVKSLSMEGSFHGRTDRPAQLSHSSINAYKKYLSSFQGRDNLVTVPVNDIEALKQVFAAAKKDKVFFDGFFLEPVMGEGNPGQGVSPEFYEVARNLTAETGTMLVVDSIQAGIRCHGCLSITSYPGFDRLPPPDMEAFSKALNGGQYPLSVLVMAEQVAAQYKVGLYGNTMTANPRALELGSAVLRLLTPELQANIVNQGKLFVDGLNSLKQDFPHIVTKVTGVGLLTAISFIPEIAVLGSQGLEVKLRHRGIGVIHGGENALRFTPHFRVTSAEIAMVLSILREELQNLAERSS